MIFFRRFWAHLDGGKFASRLGGRPPAYAGGYVIGSEKMGLLCTDVQLSQKPEHALLLLRLGNQLAD